jgi:hypothetical protein
MAREGGGGQGRGPGGNTVVCSSVVFISALKKYPFLLAAEWSGRVIDCLAKLSKLRHISTRKFPHNARSEGF